MIPTLDQTRVVSQQSEVLKRSVGILQPLLKKLLNPNIVDASVTLSLHIANGVLNHIRHGDGEPAYALALPKVWSEDDPNVQAQLTLALKVLKNRIEDKIGHGWHGVVVLSMAISCGKATISSEVDGVYKPQ
jgi:hypothetical protein